MDLFKVFSPIAKKFGKEQENVERFLAVKISDHAVFATVWHVSDEKVQIGDVFSEKVLEKTFENLLKSTDVAISKATEQTPEVSKVVFAIPEDAITDGKIEADELTTLRKLCKELDLSPLGYVGVGEALQQYFKEVEGAPLSAILIGLDGKKGTVTLVRAGKEIGTVTFDKTPEGNISLPAEIEKNLKHFGHADALPSRIIIYDGDSDLTSLANDIMAYPWTGRLPFLHFPKVEKVHSEFVVKAVAAAGGIQMGGKLTPVPGSTHFEDQEVGGKAPDSELNHTAEMAAVAMTPEFVEVSPEEAGFTTTRETVEFQEVASPVEKLPSEKKAPSLALAEVFSSVSTKLKHLGQRSEKVSSVKRGPLPKIVFIVPVVLIILIAVLGAGIIFVPKVTVITAVDSQQFDRELNVAVGTDLKANTISATEIGTKRSVTTGQKLIGTKAKGEVTIFSVAEEKSFPAGTTLTSPSGLKFTLTRDVKVASGDAASAATVTVPVEASAIGDSFNLATGTKFSIGSFSASDYVAKNDKALSGGESHNAQVVTKADQDRLMASLSAELSDKAVGDLKTKVAENETLLPNAITQSVTKKKFSADIDGEADTVSLDLTMDFQGVSFSRTSVIELFKNKFKREFPEGYEILPAQTDIDVVETETDKNKNKTLKLGVKTQLLPNLDETKIKNEIVGKNKDAASKILLATPGVKRVKFEVQPPIFAPVTTLFLPFNKDNIKVRIVKN